VTLPAADGGSLRGSRFIRANDGVACSSPMARRSGATRDAQVCLLTALSFKSSF
jgi:hypothetical protein